MSWTCSNARLKKSQLSCYERKTPSRSGKNWQELESRVMDKDNSLAENPLLASWTGPFEAPPFDRLKPSHFEQAFEAALAGAAAEAAAIAANPEPPSFENTIEALERSGHDLTRVAAVFFNLASADTNDEFEAIERDMAPRLARHRSEIYLNDALFQRIAALHARKRELG